MKKIFIHASEIVTPSGNGPLFGEEMKKLKVIEDGAIVVENSIILKVGRTDDILQEETDPYDLIHMENKAVLPGFTDAHTHFIFAGYRPEEFMMRLNGRSYMEIMNSGGGIAASVRMTREASEQALYIEGAKRLKLMLSMGVTSVEGKSGYGLDFDTEVKQLKIMRQLSLDQPVSIIPTYLGAHAVPTEYKKNPEVYIDYITKVVLPYVTQEALAEFCDVFCEEGVFSRQQSERILIEAHKQGLKLKIHADEIVSLGGAELAAELGAVSADHLLAISDRGIDSLIHKKVVATLLPCTAFSLNKPYAPARKLIDKGASVALASDFNPGSCFTCSIPLLIALSCIRMEMELSEVISALTLNGAAAVGRAATTGSIEPGKKADFIVLKYPSHKFLVYHTGMNIVERVVKNGELVYSNSGEKI